MYTSPQVANSLGRPLSAGFAVLGVVPTQTLFEDRINQLDLRVTKTVRIGRARVLGMVDVYNVFNVSSVLDLNAFYGPAFEQPTQILAARLFKVGAQFNF